VFSARILPSGFQPEKRNSRDPLKDPAANCLLGRNARNAYGVSAVRSDAACPVFRLKILFGVRGNMLDLIG